MVLETSSTAARRSLRPLQVTIDELNGRRESSSSNQTLLSSAASATGGLSHPRRNRFQPFRHYFWNVAAGTNKAGRKKTRDVVRRMVVVACFLSVYFTVYHRLDNIGTQYDIGYEQQQQQQQQQNLLRPQQTHPPNPKASLASPGVSESASVRSPPTMKSNGNNNHSLAHYLATPTIATSNPSPSEARKGREHILSILEDAGIDDFDARDVLRLPLWSSVSELYYSHHSGKRGDLEQKPNVDGPIILGLEDCARFRESVAPKDRFVGVAGNFNSGTTAFGISLQTNCFFQDRPKSDNFVVRKGRKQFVFASNANGMLSQVPWAKHKTGDYRQSNFTILPPSLAASIDHENVLPVVVVRDPFFWMQSMCKEGYGVRWDHDSKHHCPNLIPNDFDRDRFKHEPNVSISVWMGANQASGPTWPSLIHYWNAWLESYYSNQTWPRLMIRFEDTLFYPRRVMEEVCHCGGGKLRSEAMATPNQQQHTHFDFDYNLEESKPDHKHENKNNFVTAVIEYGTNATRLRNMTEQDLLFALESLNPTLMEAFGYSYPNTQATTVS